MNNRHGKNTATIFFVRFWFGDSFATHFTFSIDLLSVSFYLPFFLSSWFFPFLLIFFLPSRPTVVLKLWLASHESGKSVWETFPFPNQIELQELRPSLTFAFCEKVTQTWSASFDFFILAQYLYIQTFPNFVDCSIPANFVSIKVLLKHSFFFWHLQGQHFHGIYDKLCRRSVYIWACMFSCVFVWPGCVSSDLNFHKIDCQNNQN